MDFLLTDLKNSAGYYSPCFGYHTAIVSRLSGKQKKGICGLHSVSAGAYVCHWHTAVFAPLRSALNVCHWHTAVFAPLRSALSVCHWHTAPRRDLGRLNSYAGCVNDNIRRLQNSTQFRETVNDTIRMLYIPAKVPFPPGSLPDPDGFYTQKFCRDNIIIDAVTDHNCVFRTAAASSLNFTSFCSEGQGNCGKQKLVTLM